MRAAGRDLQHRAVTIDGPLTTLDRLIQQADKLVYAAKQDGKDCVRHRHLHRSGAGGIGFTPTPEITMFSRSSERLRPRLCEQKAMSSFGCERMAVSSS